MLQGVRRQRVHGLALWGRRRAQGERVLLLLGEWGGQLWWKQEGGEEG